MNLISKPSENQFNSRRKKLKISLKFLIHTHILAYVGQDVLPLDNNYPGFKLFPHRSDSIDNSSNRVSPSNNGVDIIPKNPSPTNAEELDLRPVTVSPFRLFGSSTTAATTNQIPSKISNTSSFKKFSSTIDKPRRKRTPKVDDNNDGQKVKRRKSDINMNQKQLTLTELQMPMSAEKKANLNLEISMAKVIHWQIILIKCFLFS